MRASPNAYVGMSLNTHDSPSPTLTMIPPMSLKMSTTTGNIAPDIKFKK